MAPNSLKHDIKLNPDEDNVFNMLIGIPELDINSPISLDYYTDLKTRFDTDLSHLIVSIGDSAPICYNVGKHSVEYGVPDDIFESLKIAAENKNPIQGLGLVILIGINCEKLQHDKRFENALFQVELGFNGLARQDDPIKRPGLLDPYLADKKKIGSIAAIDAFAALVYRRYLWGIPTKNAPDDPKTYEKYPGIPIKEEIAGVYSNLKVTIGGHLDILGANYPSTYEKSGRYFQFARGVGIIGVENCSSMIGYKNPDDLWLKTKSEISIHQALCSTLSSTFRPVASGDVKNMEIFDNWVHALIFASYFNTLCFAHKCKTNKVVLTLVEGCETLRNGGYTLLVLAIEIATMKYPELKNIKIFMAIDSQSGKTGERFIDSAETIKQPHLTLEISKIDSTEKFNDELAKLPLPTKPTDPSTSAAFSLSSSQTGQSSGKPSAEAEAGLTPPTLSESISTSQHLEQSTESKSVEISGIVCDDPTMSGIEDTVIGRTVDKHDFLRIFTGISEGIPEDYANTPAFYVSLKTGFDESLSHMFYTLTKPKRTICYAVGKHTIINYIDKLVPLSGHPPASEYKIYLLAGASVNNVRLLQSYDRFRGATFQVASNFNGLEQTRPENKPGLLSHYYEDHTQGPAAAISAFAALVYRRYLWGILGKSAPDDAATYREYPGVFIKKEVSGIYTGLDTTIGGWLDIRNAKFENSDKTSEEEFLVGIASGVGIIGIKGCSVVIRYDADDNVHAALKSTMLINQALCSTVDYKFASGFATLKDINRWSLACLISSYYNTIRFGLECGSDKIVLTLIGGGAFDNPFENIIQSLKYAIELLLLQFPNQMANTKIFITCRTSPQRKIEDFIAKMQSTSLFKCETIRLSHSLVVVLDAK